MPRSRRPDQVKIVEMSVRQCSKERMEKKEEQYRNLTWKEIDAEFISLDEAAEVLGYKRVNYVRQLTLGAKLEGVRVEMRGFSKWFIERVSIDWYRNNKARSASIRRFVLRISPDDELAVVTALDELKKSGSISNYTLELAYKGNSDDAEEG